MDVFTAVTIIEHSCDENDEAPVSDAQIRSAWQHLVDTGVVWNLQGWYGRAASAMLESGFLHQPHGKMQ